VVKSLSVIPLEVIFSSLDLISGSADPSFSIVPRRVSITLSCSSKEAVTLWETLALLSETVFENGVTTSAKALVNCSISFFHCPKMHVLIELIHSILWYRFEL